MTLAEVLNKSNRIIILGDPGAGKSTMMQYVTLKTASRLRGQNRQSSDVPKRLPVFIRLNRFHDIKNWPPEKDLIFAIKGDVEANLLSSVPEKFLEKKLEKGECLILLDAFDELASSKARQLLAEKVKNTVARYQNNQFVVTSRITGYSNQLSSAGFDNPYTIQKLSKDNVKEFIKRWYQHITHLNSIDKNEKEIAFIDRENVKKANNLTDAILQNDRILQLAVNPMLLSLIALVHYVRVKLPEQRHLLYHDCIDILVEQWDVVKDVHSPILEKLTVKEKKQILQTIAWYMHANKLKSMNRKAVIDDILKQKTCSEIYGEKIAEQELEILLREIQERTGLLIEKGFNEQGQPELSFSHLTFQVYLAALELFSMYKDENQVFLVLYVKR